VHIPGPDFAVQDVVIDYLILLQAQQAALADAHHMAETSKR
jgi:hypothetical protein